MKSFYKVAELASLLNRSKFWVYYRLHKGEFVYRTEHKTTYISIDTDEIEKLTKKQRIENENIKIPVEL